MLPDLAFTGRVVYSVYSGSHGFNRSLPILYLPGWVEVAAPCGQIHLPPHPSCTAVSLIFPISVNGTTSHPVAQTKNPGVILIASVSTVPTLGSPVESLSSTYSTLATALTSTANTLSRPPAHFSWAQGIDS